jgi:hypothetical protein
MSNAVATQSRSAHDDEPRPTPQGSWLWKILGVLLLCGLAICLTAGLWLYIRHQGYKQQLNAVVERIRASGEPVDGNDLNAFYKVSPDAVDLTPIYLRALARFKEPSPLTKEAGNLPIVGMGEDPIPAVGTDWPQLGEAEALLARYADTLALLHEGAQQRGDVRYPLDATQGFAALLPYTQASRDGARLLSLEFHVRLHRDDLKGAADSLIAQVRLSETLKNEPLLVSQLVRYAVFGMAIKSLEVYLAQGTLAGDDLARLSEVFAEPDFERSLVRAMQGERAIGFQSMTQETMESLSQNASGIPGQVETGRQIADLRPGDAAVYLEFITEQIEAARFPFPLALAEAEAADQRLQQFIASEQNALPWDRHMLAQMLMPATNAMFVATARTIALQRTALAAIALERHRLANEGKLPESLNELVPDFLSAVPSDPYDGKPLRYRLGEEDCVVYSVFKNLLDDGGDLGAEMGAGTDVGMRLPREKP